MKITFNWLDDHRLFARFNVTNICVVNALTHLAIAFSVNGAGLTIGTKKIEIKMSHYLI